VNTPLRDFIILASSTHVCSLYVALDLIDAERSLRAYKIARKAHVVERKIDGFMRKSPVGAYRRRMGRLWATGA